MINKLFSWFIKKKFQDESGADVYKGVSLTKVGLVLLAVLKSIETVSSVLFDQSFIGAPLVIPKPVYELIAMFTGIAAREAIVTTEVPKK